MQIFFLNGLWRFLKNGHLPVKLHSSALPPRSDRGHESERKVQKIKSKNSLLIYFIQEKSFNIMYFQGTTTVTDHTSRRFLISLIFIITETPLFFPLPSLFLPMACSQASWKNVKAFSRHMILFVCLFAVCLSVSLEYPSALFFK